MVNLVCGYNDLDGLSSISFRRNLRQKGLSYFLYNRRKNHLNKLPFNNILVMSGSLNGQVLLEDSTIGALLEEYGCYEICLELHGGLLPLNNKKELLQVSTSNILPVVISGVKKNFVYMRSQYLLLQVLNALVSIK